jgi:hypothetical protein
MHSEKKKKGKVGKTDNVSPGYPIQNIEIMPSPLKRK